MFTGTCLNLNFDSAHTSSPTAEESGAGKQILLEKGAYKDMDICIMYVQ
jgi:hypothetical protein